MQPELSKYVVVVEETKPLEMMLEAKFDETQEEEIYQQIYYEYDTELYENGNGEGFFLLRNMNGNSNQMKRH